MWWLVFSVPLVKNCEQTSGKPYKKGDVGASIKNVFTTMKEIGADKPMLIYIISYFFYIDGVHTIISMSTSYGTNLGLDSAGMLLALLLVQVLGLPFCLLYMKLAEKFGARTMVGRALRHQPGRHSGAVPLDVRQAHSRQVPQRRVLRLL